MRRRRLRRVARWHSVSAVSHHDALARQLTSWENTTGVRCRIPRVAVIDDEQMILNVVTRCLRDYVVVSHNDGDSAIAWLRELVGARRTPDLILCDLCLGGVSGIDVYEAIERELPSLADRVVFLTGGGCSSRDEAFLSSREAATLRKPFTPAVLRAWVSERLTAVSD